MTPTEEAKNFLKKRLNAEHHMTLSMREEMTYAAKEIISIAKKYNIPIGKLSSATDPIIQQKIEAVIQRLIEALYNEVEDICIQADEEQRNYILAFINMSIYGMTLSSRITSWANKFIPEVKKMYDTKFFDTWSRIPIKTGAPQGMDRLLRHTISRAWMESKKQSMMNKGAKYFSTHRGSSYPCATCDDEQAKGIQPISMFSLPLHNNCCCYALFYDENQQPIK